MSSGINESGLSRETLEVHRALASLQEELEAIDYYHQRVDVTQEPELRAVLAHNRDDECEHAAMLLEWLRRALPALDRRLRPFLFTGGAIAPAEASAAVPPGPGPDGVGLGLGRLR
jgi:hypothetical protein